MANYIEYGGADGYASHLRQSRLVDAAGHQAAILSVEDTGADPQAWIQCGDGPQVMVPVSLLIQEAEDEYRLPFSFNTSPQNQDNAGLTLPVIQEQLHLDKRLVDTGKGVRLHKKVVEQEQVIDPPLLQDELAVEHIPVGRVVADQEMPQPRYDGDTLVVPVLEEVLVVQKQLLLKEEVRITRKRVQVHKPQKVSLRSEQIDVEHFDEGKSQ